MPPQPANPVSVPIPVPSLIHILTLVPVPSSIHIRPYSRFYPQPYLQPDHNLTTTEPLSAGAESFRKALVYQKKYLLLLLGGFQETEADTLALVAQVPPRSRHRPGEAARRRWRRVGLMLISAARLRILLRKWHRQG